MMGDGFKMMGFNDEPEPSQQLLIELVPSTAFGDNLRSRLSKRDWDRVRKNTYRKAGYCCEICHGKGKRHPVECHEVWEYDDGTHVQKLVRTIALCPACHRVKHFGFARMSGTEKQARFHLMRVNGWPPEFANRHIREAFEVWERRSHHNWTLDLSWLEEGYDIKL